MSKDGFARTLGHKKAEGRFFYKLDALKLYKLVDEEGDDVVLTPLAINIVVRCERGSADKGEDDRLPLPYEDSSKTFAECPKRLNGYHVGKDLQLRHAFGLRRLASRRTPHYNIVRRPNPGANGSRAAGRPTWAAS